MNIIQTKTEELKDDKTSQKKRRDTYNHRNRHKRTTVKVKDFWRRDIAYHRKKIKTIATNITNITRSPIITVDGKKQQHRKINTWLCTQNKHMELMWTQQKLLYKQWQKKKRKVFKSKKTSRLGNYAPLQNIYQLLGGCGTNSKNQTFWLIIHNCINVNCRIILNYGLQY